MALLASSPASGQELLSPALPPQPELSRQLEPSAERSPSWLLALWGVSPYAELQDAQLPLPPSPADVAALSARQRLQEETAIKTVWMERLIRAREQRNRITPENIARVAGLAQAMGAPDAFTEALRRQVAGDVSAVERHLLELALQWVLESYGVNAREMRFFVEGCGLTPAQLREVVAWLPLAALFRLPAAKGQGRAALASSQGAEYVASLVALRDSTQVLRSVSDRETADAAAEALLPILLCSLSARESLMAAPPHEREELEAPYAPFARPVNEAAARERSRLEKQRWFGSPRLQALDYLLH